MRLGTESQSVLACSERVAQLWEQVFFGLHAHASYRVLAGADVWGKLLFCTRLRTSEAVLISRICSDKSTTFAIEESPLADTVRDFVDRHVIRVTTQPKCTKERWRKCFPAGSSAAGGRVNHAEENHRAIKP